MLFLKNVLGLDLGSHTLKAVELRQTLRGIEAVSLHSLRRGDPAISLSELAGGLVRTHGLSVENVVSAIPSDRISARRLEFPFRDRRRLAQAVPFEVAAALPFELDEFVVDWDIVGGDRSRSEVLAAIVRRREVSDLLGSLRASACEPHILEAEGLVLANLVFTDLGLRNVCNFFVNTAYGQGLSDVFTETFEALGGTVSAAVPHEQEETTYVSLLQQCVGQ